jgi:hypothetical protein
VSSEACDKVKEMVTFSLERLEKFELVDIVSKKALT